MPRRNANRARRRNADRNRKNALALAAVGEAAAESNLRKNARHEIYLDILLRRRGITPIQRDAGIKLYSDFVASGSQIGRLISTYAPPTPRGTGARDTPGVIAARERFEAALKDAGRGLAPILMHTCITDEPPTTWPGLNGRAATEGLPVLKVALDVLAEFYRVTPRREEAA